jgi:pimeloyl-ACP methyl ester carboxylesterase
MFASVIKRTILALVGIAAIGAGLWLYTPDGTRADLEARYLAQPSDLRVIDGVRLHIRDTGPRTAPVIVLMHGMASSLHTWEPWAKALESQYRVVRFDFPGHGLSGADPAGDYHDARTLRLVTALFDSLGITRATVVGNSMGGRIAWSFAAAHPERVAKLVLISPDGFASPGFEYNKPADVPAALAAMKWVLPRAMLRAQMEPAYGDPAALTDSTTTRYWDLMIAPGNREALLNRMRQVMLTDPVPRLQSITAPTLLIWGVEDQMIPIANAQDYLKALPHARLVTLPGLGHVPFEEAPARALEPLRQFLNE